MLAVVALSLLAGTPTENTRPLRHTGTRPLLHGGDATLAFSAAHTINGGLVGLLGPALPTFQSSTGLSQAGLGRAVLINRLSKLAGTFAWTLYARRLERRDLRVPPPRVLLASCMVAAAGCALAIAAPALRSSPLALQASLAAFGAAYGFTDPGFTLLTLWSLHGRPTEQRTHIGYLNAGYTLGALATPALVAVSLAAGGDVYACFYALSASATLAAIALAATTAASHAAVVPPRRSATATAPATSKAAHAPEPQGSSVVVTCMAVVLFAVTGCEHGTATWLPYARKAPQTPAEQLTGRPPCMTELPPRPSDCDWRASLAPVAQTARCFRSPCVRAQHLCRPDRWSARADFGGDQRHVLGGHLRWTTRVGGPLACRLLRLYRDRRRRERDAHRRPLLCQLRG